MQKRGEKNMSDQENEQPGTGLLVKIILPVFLIFLGVAGYSYFMKQKPKMKRKPPEKQVTLVETISIKPGNYQSSISAMGTVIPDNKIILKSRVAGEVTAISQKFVQGGIIQKGELLLELDDADYKIDVQKAQSELDKAMSALAMEKGSQLIAKEELKLINGASKEEIISTDLALRKPQLIQAQAAVNTAMASLEKAQLNMKRTKVIVPFNALILEKNVSTGSLVSAQGSIATLVSVDTYLVEAQIPPDRLNTISTDQNSNNAIIESQYSNQTWQARVVRTTGKISDNSRMAGVIISVSDPLGLKDSKSKGQLLIDDHVGIKIMGKILKNVFPIPRSILREDNTLWIYNSGALDIKKVGVVWKEDKKAYIKSGISEDDEIIISDLPAAIKGMTLQLSAGATQ
jgi:RND family efflux transporter MFP subunit